MTTPSILGPKSTENLGGLNFEKSVNGLFLRHSKTGSWAWEELDDFPCELSLVTCGIVDTGGGTWELVMLPPAPLPLPAFDKLTDEEEPGDEQFNDWASEAAAALGSDTSAHGAYEEPAMRMDRWNNPTNTEIKAKCTFEDEEKRNFHSFVLVKSA